MLARALLVFSDWLVPVLLVLILIHAYWKRVKVFEIFAEGAKEALTLAGSIFPYLLAMLIAIGILRASGALEFLSELLAPLLAFLGIPKEVLPMALLRPLSGSGALGVMTTLIAEYGPDSLIGRIASTMQGSTETTFYVLAVYFGSVGITSYRHALWVGLLSDLAAFLTAVWVCRLVFS
ncbi:MAG: spore maturation protein [Firmicutes bacterium]|nr:spore maturation protein [Bacillota bacterium]